MKHFFLRRFCRIDSTKTDLLRPASFGKHGVRCNLPITRIFLCFICEGLIIFLLRAGNIGCPSAGREEGGKERMDISGPDGGGVQTDLVCPHDIDMETLFMTICDADGVKRLLSPGHPAILTKGLYFLFPDDVRDYEIYQNDGAWRSVEQQVYLRPQKGKAAKICVRFRARGSNGEIRYSRSYLLLGAGDGNVGEGRICGEMSRRRTRMYLRVPFCTPVWEQQKNVRALNPCCDIWRTGLIGMPFDAIKYHAIFYCAATEKTTGKYYIKII